MSRDTTIVKLGPKSNASEVASFDQAFGNYNLTESEMGVDGEYSEARGRGRSRRQKRRLDRKKKRQERKTTKIKMRGERRALRQESRAAQQEARQQRKDVRKKRKTARKEMGAPEEGAFEEDLIETGTESEGGYADSGYEEGPEDTGYQGGEGEGESETTEDSDIEAAYDEEGDDEGYYDEGYYDEEGTEGDDSGFDGVMGAEDRFSDFNDESTVQVSPPVGDLAKKIEWNKELVSRLRIKRAIALGKDGDVDPIDIEINNRLLRIAELEAVMGKYSRFEGEFSMANGLFTEFSNAEGKKSIPAAKKRQRAQEIRKARKQARIERIATRKNNKNAKRLENRKNKVLSRGYAGDVTPVESELNPEFSKQRIVIPAEEIGSFTGINALDNKNDYDSPRTRVVELKSNADGTKTGVNWKGIAIGVGVAAVAIWAIRKYKVLGK